MTGTDVRPTVQSPASPHTDVATRLLDGRVGGRRAGRVARRPAHRLRRGDDRPRREHDDDAGCGWPVPTATRRRSRPDRTTARRSWSPDGRWLAFGSRRGEKEQRGDAARAAGRRARRGAHGRRDARRHRRRGLVARRRAGWRSPAAPATPATRPRTSAGSRRARSRRSSPASTTRAGSSTGPQHVYVVAADGTGAPRNLTPGPFQHDGVAWLADSSGVVTRRGTPRRLGPRPVPRTSTSSRSTARSAPSPSRPGATATRRSRPTARPSRSSAPTTPASIRRTPRSA